MAGVLSDDERQPGGIQDVVPGAAAVHLWSCLRGRAVSVRHKPRQRRFTERGELSQLTVDLLYRRAFRHRRNQPHQGSLSAVAGQSVPEDVPANDVLVSQTAVSFTEPVVDELTLAVALDHNAIDGPGAVAGGGGNRVRLERFDLPATGRQAQFGRMN